MTQTTDQKLANIRGKIKQWESRLRRAANKLAAYRAHETRLIRKQTAEITKAASGPERPRRKIEVPEETAST